MIKQKNTYLSLVAVFVLFLTGCANNSGIKVIDQISNPCDKSLAMRTAQRKLRQMNFAIEKFDIEEGYIRTKSISGGQIFEFWRKDNVGAFNTAESNLHTIRRVVELDFSQSASGTEIVCEVKTYRLSVEESEVASRSKAPGLFSAKDSGSLRKLRLPSGRKRWIELGNDERLATLILDEINDSLPNN